MPQRFHPAHFQEATSSQNSQTNGGNTNAVTSTENSKTEVPCAEGTHYKELPRPPYNCLNKDPKEFIGYLMGNPDRKAYNADIRCLAAFYSQATILARHVIASTITTLVAANRGVHFLAPLIPRELMSSPNNPTDAEPPGAPACSDDYQMDIRVHCV